MAVTRLCVADVVTAWGDWVSAILLVSLFLWSLNLTCLKVQLPAWIGLYTPEPREEGKIVK